MGAEKRRATRSQIAGIVWLSVALLIAVAALFFSRHGSGNAVQNDSLEALETEKLTLREDSVYRSRRVQNGTLREGHPERTYPAAEERVAEGTHATPAPQRRPLSIELNSADSLTFQLLHGIGPTYARRIVRYRERLGGFVSTDQLLEVYGFTPELLNHILTHLTLDTAAIERIPVNSIELKQLIRHPYIEYYQARDIVALRRKGVVFRNADDLRAIPSMADSTISRLLPYIDFGTN